jgi:hypothetical protein
MMKQLATIALVSCLPLLVGCTKNVPVSRQGPATLDVKTYSVLSHPVGTTLSTNHQFQKRIHEAMAKKGYLPASRADADLLVTFKTLSMPKDGDPTYGESRQGVETLSLMSLASGGAGFSPGDEVHNIVLVMLEEASSDRVMWVGWSAADVDDDDVISTTGESIDRILAMLPAQRGFMTAQRGL